MHSRLIIIARNISSSPVFAQKFRVKTPKELYRYGKSIVLT